MAMVILHQTPYLHSNPSPSTHNSRYILLQDIQTVSTQIKAPTFPQISVRKTPKIPNTPPLLLTTPCSSSSSSPSPPPPPSSPKPASPPPHSPSHPSAPPSQQQAASSAPSPVSSSAVTPTSCFLRMSVSV